jgi:hypothetical protein
MSIPEVLAGTTSWHVHCGDALDFLGMLPEHSVDLVFFSPPYSTQRSYGIGFSLEGEAWVAWMVKVIKACLRVCKGLVGCVCEGPTRKYRWTALPALLTADLHRSGVHLRKTVVYHRNGLCGSGGTDWLRNDWEHVLCCTNGGRLPWSDPTACGLPCKYGVGGELSYRTPDGVRINARKASLRKKYRKCQRLIGLPMSDGTIQQQSYTPPEIANPGNVVKCVVGGGRIGDELAHANEAPYPERLADFFVRSFCRPGGIVVDPMAGSGTTGKCAIVTGRRFLGCDIRQSQVDLSNRRIKQAIENNGCAGPEKTAKSTTTATERTGERTLFDDLDERTLFDDLDDACAEAESAATR